jgi:hypothetical protein
MAWLLSFPSRLPFDAAIFAMNENKNQGVGRRVIFFTRITDFFGFLTTVIFGVLVIIALRYLGLSQNIFFVLIVIGGGYAIFEFTRIIWWITHWKKLLDSATQAAPSIPQLPLSQEEKLLIAISNIAACGLLRYKPFIKKSRNSAPFYTDPRPENAMLITDAHVIFVYVPLPYGDQVVVGGQSIADQNRIFASKDIAAKLTQLLASESLSDLYSSYRGNFSLPNAEITSVKYNDNSRWITFITANNGEFSYTILAKDDYLKVKEVLQALKIGDGAN